MPRMLSQIPLSLYIHIPWCVRKCPYCDFNSHEMRENISEDLYIERLIVDLETQLIAVNNRALISIFFGGGTPSLFTPKSIEKIIKKVKERIAFAENIEITLEANPGTVDNARFLGFREAGINRLSIGIQSLQDEKLKNLGRIHHREAALRAIDAAVNAGFNNFNLDLMHGLPQQSLEEACQDLKDALLFHPPHLSWYQLTIEPNTFFHYQPPTLPNDDILWEIQEQGQLILQNAKLNQYEISAYAQTHFECIHNKNYWEFGDYLGIGAGAHSKMTNVEKQIIFRQSRIKNPRDYLNPNKNLIANEKILTEKELIFEFLLNALRLTKGVSNALFVKCTGLSLSHLEPTLSILKDKNLMMRDSQVLCTTPLGQRYLNDVIGMFL